MRPYNYILAAIGGALFLCALVMYGLAEHTDFMLLSLVMLVAAAICSGAAAVAAAIDRAAEAYRFQARHHPEKAVQARYASPGRV